MCNGSDAAHDFAVPDDEVVFLRHWASVIGQDEAREPAGNALGFQNVHGRLADEVRLLAADRPAHSGFRRMGQAVGVLSDDNVALFQAQYALGLDAHGPDAEGPPAAIALSQSSSPRLAGTWIS